MKKNKLMLKTGDCKGIFEICPICLLSSVLWLWAWIPAVCCVLEPPSRADRQRGLWAGGRCHRGAAG